MVKVFTLPIYALRENSSALKNSEIERNDDGFEEIRTPDPRHVNRNATQTKPYFSSGLAQWPCPLAFKPSL
jgi:hypothetical protein